TQTVPERDFPFIPYTSRVENGVRIIHTRALTLRYQQGSGAFTPENLSIQLHTGDAKNTARPDWTSGPLPQSLGGWRRSLDDDQKPQPLYNGILSRRGWYLLNDSNTVLLTDQPPGFTTRSRKGNYQDGYFFGYGHDYTQALADLRHLTGPALHLPRKALGVWFSHYWAYSAADIHALLAQFRAHDVPLDDLSLDTDWKRMFNAEGCKIINSVTGATPGDPCSWN